MNKLDPKTDGATVNIVEENIKRLRELFPEAFTESSAEGEPRFKVDFDALRQILGDYVEDQQERYRFTWNGKSRARRIAQTPSTGTLRPCPEESVNWDTTQNLFIEGDNLEVLKLLQKSYHKRVKMIYIDPPYNTGKEFIYPDKFQDNLDTYLRYTGQVDAEGFKLSANAETSGRYHTNWLNMMMPRLKLARNLLRDDGIIFISIDDNEVTNLRKLCDEVYGEENFVAQFTWETKRAARGVPPKNLLMETHEYVVCYGRSHDSVRFRGLDRDEADFANPDNDPRGLWRSESMKATGNQDNYFTITDPTTGNEFYANWAFSQDTVNQMIADNLVLFPESPDGVPRQKKFIDSYTNETKAAITALGWHSTESATKQLMALFDGKKIFDFPKPLSLLEFFCEQSLADDDIVLDFFAGSAGTAHAVLDLNKNDGGNRKFIMVQLPEPCDEKSEAFKAGYKTIADIGKERIRRVIKKIEAEQKAKAKDEAETLPGAQEKISDLDLGFKVFKLDASNIKPWDADFDNLDQALFDSVENIKPNRSEMDVLYELLLKFGLDLAVPIEERTIAGRKVFIIGAGALVACLASDVTIEAVEGIARLKEELKPEIMRVVFKDAGFKDDVVKTNAVQILRQAGIEDVKSL